MINYKSKPTLSVSKCWTPIVLAINPALASMLRISKFALNATVLHCCYKPHSSLYFNAVRAHCDLKNVSNAL